MGFTISKPRPVSNLVWGCFCSYMSTYNSFWSIPILWFSSSNNLLQRPLSSVRVRCTCDGLQRHTECGRRALCWYNALRTCQKGMSSWAQRWSICGRQTCCTSDPTSSGKLQGFVSGWWRKTTGRCLFCSGTHGGWVGLHSSCQWVYCSNTWISIELW